MSRPSGRFQKMGEKLSYAAMAAKIITLHLLRPYSHTADRVLSQLEADENQQRLRALERMNAPRMGLGSKEEIFKIPDFVLGAHGEKIPVVMSSSKSGDKPRLP